MNLFLFCEGRCTVLIIWMVMFLRLTWLYWILTDSYWWLESIQLLWDAYFFSTTPKLATGNSVIFERKSLTFDLVEPHSKRDPGSNPKVGVWMLSLCLWSLSGDSGFLPPQGHTVQLVGDCLSVSICQPFDRLVYDSWDRLPRTNRLIDSWTSYLLSIILSRSHFLQKDTTTLIPALFHLFSVKRLRRHFL